VSSLVSRRSPRRVRPTQLAERISRPDPSPSDPLSFKPSLDGVPARALRSVHGESWPPNPPATSAPRARSPPRVRRPYRAGPVSARVLDHDVSSSPARTHERSDPQLDTFAGRRRGRISRPKPASSDAPLSHSLLLGGGLGGELADLRVRDARASLGDGGAAVTTMAARSFCVRADVSFGQDPLGNLVRV
jgi:hypothetical protein